MKRWLTVIMAALALGGCANQDTGYWNARAAAIAALPPEQRPAARIELLRDQHAQQELQRQRIHEIVNASVW